MEYMIVEPQPADEIQQTPQLVWSDDIKIEIDQLSFEAIITEGAMQGVEWNRRNREQWLTIAQCQ